MRNYLFRMNIMEEIVKIRNCIEIMTNDSNSISYTMDKWTICPTVYKLLQGIHFKLKT